MQQRGLNLGCRWLDKSTLRWWRMEEEEDLLDRGRTFWFYNFYKEQIHHTSEFSRVRFWLCCCIILNISGKFLSLQNAHKRQRKVKKTEAGCRKQQTAKALLTRRKVLVSQEKFQYRLQKAQAKTGRISTMTSVLQSECLLLS